MGIPLDDRMFGHSTQNGGRGSSAFDAAVKALLEDNKAQLTKSIEEFNKVKAAYEAAQMSLFETVANAVPAVKQFEPPKYGERILLLLLSKDARANIPGDLEEEFKQIAAKHGARYAKLWYYKQVAASAWPMIRKATRLGMLAWVEEWIRRRI